MEKICIIYDSVSGSTAEIAGIIAKELSAYCETDMYHIDDAVNLKKYNTIILGSPMRFGGFKSGIKSFIKEKRGELDQKKIICYISMLYIVRIENEPDINISYHVDPSLDIQTLSHRQATFFDKTHTLNFYHKNIMENLKGLNPEKTAFFNGRLDLKQLGPVPRIFMKIVTLLTKKERVGDFLNPETVKKWAMEVVKQN